MEGLNSRMYITEGRYRKKIFKKKQKEKNDDTILVKQSRMFRNTIKIVKNILILLSKNF